MNIGERINRLRKESGLSQDDFANLFHVSRQTVSNWENGVSHS
ncbi:helix-turn-helix domain-containing protein [Blautia schinkii]|nr:helix-turn-helix domain-containing protein [Blautia schinkii]